MQKIFRLLMVGAAIILGGFYFVHWSRTRALNSGEVHVRQQPDDKPSPDISAASSARKSDAAAQPSQPQEVASSSAKASGTDPSRSGYQGPSRNVASLPASETISRQPPNGIVAAGPGKFQLYRQGDMTFRLNTETGQACVLLATDAQWRKPLVYHHGCGNR